MKEKYNIDYNFLLFKKINNKLTKIKQIFNLNFKTYFKLI